MSDDRPTPTRGDSSETTSVSSRRATDAPPGHDGGAAAPAGAVGGGRLATNGGSGGMIFDVVTRVEDTSDDLFDSQAVREAPDQGAHAYGRPPGSCSYWSNVREVLMHTIERVVMAGQRASEAYTKYEESSDRRLDRSGIGSIA
jgi:hypothetical protein